MKQPKGGEKPKILCAPIHSDFMFMRSNSCPCVCVLFD
jgi:hypothetical protein